MDTLALQVKQAGILWFAGFREACCLYRVVFFCTSSRTLLVRTGQCFLLNGFIFLGSLFVLNSVVIPILLWILPDKCDQLDSWDLCNHESALRLYSSLRSVLIELFYIFWFYPLYAFSFILSGLWYNDIAKNAFVAMGRSGPSTVKSPSKNGPSDSQSSVHMDGPAGFERVIIGIGEQVYSVILLGFFFVEVLATGYIPFIGKVINFILLSWMYAYYCFEYKWNLSEVSLDKRLDLFESNWAFFAGFGSPCVLAIFFSSPLVSYGVMAMLFPLFVLTATGTHAEQVIDSYRRSWKLGPKKLPIFYAANTLSMQVLQLFPEVPNKQQ